MITVKVLPKGQITIPAEIRKNLDIDIGDHIYLEKISDGYILKKNPTIFDVIGKIKVKENTDTKQLVKKCLEDYENEETEKIIQE